MDDFQPECIIVSNSRYSDLEPYCSYIYNHDPGRWHSIFPWEFPQNGTKDEEEKFLHRYFSKTEIHMQGFRFLKQVWYSIALYNLNQRVPAFTNWWLAKPSSIELLNDTKLQPFLFRQDVTPSTFFSDELSQYGEKFLSVVVPYLQRTAKELLQKRETKKRSIDTSNDTIARQQVSRKVSDYDPPKTNQSVDSADQIVQTTVSLPSPGNVQQRSAPEIPQSAPALMTAIEIARPQVPSNAQAAHRDIQLHPRKRGNSINRRHNHRGGGTFSTRQATSFNQHSPHMYPSPNYGPTPELLHNHPRVPSGGPIDFMPALSQAQQLQALPRHIQYISPQYGHSNSIQQPLMPQDVQFAPGTPHPYFNHPFGDRSNTQHLPDRGFNVEQHVPYFHDPSSFHGWHHTNNQGSRGGKPPRGNYGARGKNSRGRNSCSSIDRPHFAHRENINSKPFGDFPGNSYAQKNRRGSVIHETNWRSGSDNPQIQHNELMIKENILPNQPFGGPEHHRSMSLVPQSQAMSSTSLPFGANPAHPSARQAPGLGNTLPTSFQSEAPLRMIDPNTLTIDQTCTASWIGKDCTYVNKLLVIDVPESVSENMVGDFFSRLGSVKKVSRSLSSCYEKSGKYLYLMWVTFANAAEARKCLLDKPDYWFHNRPLRVEVPRMFWMPSHTKYVFGSREHTMSLPEEPKAVTQVHAILRRSVESPQTPNDASVERPVTEETQSADVTPTPSGASTPKKKNSSRKKTLGKNKKKEKEDLRKTSLTANVDQLERSQNVDAQKDTESTVNIPDDGRAQETIEFVDVDEPATLNISNVEKQRSASQQSEIQTTSEPAFSQTDIVETRLPASPVFAASQPGSANQLQPVSAQTEIQTTSELAFSPMDAITTRLPEYPSPFRAEEKTATATMTTQIAAIEDDLVLSPTDDIKYLLPGDHNLLPARFEAASGTTQAPGANDWEMQPLSKANDPTKVAPIPCKSDDEPVDDSFHTASGSPDSDKCAGAGNEHDLAKFGKATFVPWTEESQLSVEQAIVDDRERSDSVVTPASPESSVSPKTIKKVHIPQLPMRTRLESASSSSTTKLDVVELPHCLRPATSPALLTSAYFTAPNTPAVPQKSLAEEEEWQEEGSQPEPQRAKKAERPKGPAQTESLSLFGKKKEKKSKGGKKGTLKGKPKVDASAASEIISSSTSRAMSGATTPNIETPAKVVEATTNIKEAGEEMASTDSKHPGCSATTPKTSQATEKATAEDLVAPPTPQQETPSKRKAFGNLFSGLSIFTGSQQSLHFTKSDHSLSSKKSLTGAKAQDRPPEKDMKKLGETLKDIASTGKVGGMATQEQVRDSKSSLVENVDVPDFDSGEVPEYGLRGGQIEVGLDLFNTSDERSVDCAGKSKKKPKKKERSKKKPVEGPKDEEQSSTPVSESKTASWLFRFGIDTTERFMGDKTTEHHVARPAPVVDLSSAAVIQRAATPSDEQVEPTELERGVEGSDASSRTASQDPETPSSEMQSPTISGSGKKLPSKPPGQGHLVEAKDPNWKQKKRVVTPRKPDTPPESDAEENAIWYIQGGLEKNSQLDDAEPKRPEKLYVYVGRGPREDIDRSEVKQSRGKLQQLAREEQLKLKATSAPKESQLSD